VSKTFQALTTVFHSPATNAQMVLPDGCRFVILMRGETPTVTEMDGPGEYEMGFDELGDTEWPIAVCTIDAAHAVAWAGLDIATVGRMFDRIEGMVAKVRAAQSTPEGSE